MRSNCAIRCGLEYSFRWAAPVRIVCCDMFSVIVALVRLGFRTYRFYFVF